MLKNSFKILCIQPSLPYDDTSPENKFTCLAKEKGISSDVIVLNPFNTRDLEMVKVIANLPYNTKVSYHLNTTRGEKIGFWKQSKFVIQKAIALSKKNQYDAILVYGTQLTGLYGILLKVLLKGTKLITMVQTNPIACVNDQPFLKRKLKLLLTRWVLNCSDHLHLLYKNQLIGFKNCKTPFSVFHDYVSIGDLEPSEKDEDKYILFLGFPFFKKGVDILIKAFNQVSDEFPDVTLKIVGHCEDFYHPWMVMANRNPRIKFYKAVFHQEALELINKCSLFVLPSRLEGLPRVIIEAMLLSKLVIASNVDGIPSIIIDNQTGLLFENENSGQLAEKLRMALSAKDGLETISKNGYRFAKEHLSPEVYAEESYKMLEKVCRNENE